MVLLAIDGSVHSQAAVKLTAGITFPAGTIAHVLAVVPERWLLSHLNWEAKRLLVETMDVGHQADYAAADLLVIGAKGLSAPDEFRLGSTAHKLAHYAKSSVVVARPADHAQPIRIILAADCSIEAQRATAFLCKLALLEWAEVTVIRVAEVNTSLPAANGTTEQDLVADVPEAVCRVLIDAAEGQISKAGLCLNKCGTQVRSAIRFGHPAEESLNAACEYDADLIVIGARGQTRAEPFQMGGVAQKVVKDAFRHRAWPRALQRPARPRAMPW